MMLLRCFDEYNLFATLGDDGILSTQSIDASVRPAVEGMFSTLPTGVTLALYRQDGRLLFRSDSHVWAHDDIAAVRHEEADDNRQLVIEHRLGVEVVAYPKPEVLIAPSEDPTPFVSSEDNDFGLFVANVLADPDRAGRIFSSASDMVDVSQLGFEQALELLAATDWEQEANGPDSERAISSLRQLLRFRDTAVVAAAGRRLLAGEDVGLVAQLLDTLARADEETQDVLLNAIVEHWHGATGPMPDVLRRAADPSMVGQPPKTVEGLALVVEALNFTENTQPRPRATKALSAEEGSLPLYSRQGDGEYFENDVADRWPERHWGYWGVVMNRMGLPVARESDRFFRTDSSSSGLREEVANYLERAPDAVVGQQPDSPCYLCDQSFNMAAHRTDGEWLWPANMGHLVREHGFVVPNELVDHIRAVGAPPDQLDIAIEDLPWPAS